MKTFIVFLGLFLMASMGFCFAGDYQLYMHEQTSLKAAAEECAAGAALEIDEGAYAEGRTIFDKTIADERVKEHFEHYMSDISCCEIFAYKYFVEFYDDAGYYGLCTDSNGRKQLLNEDNSEIFKDNDYKNYPTVAVTLYLETEDVIGLNFIDINQFCRKSAYELKNPKL